MPFDDAEEPTAKTCPECKGEGTLTITVGTRYTVKTCGWCKGKGRVPVSQVKMPAVKS